MLGGVIGIGKRKGEMGTEGSERKQK